MTSPDEGTEFEGIVSGLEGERDYTYAYVNIHKAKFWQALTVLVTFTILFGLAVAAPLVWAVWSASF